MKSRKNLMLLMLAIVVVVMGIWVIQLFQGTMPFVDRGTMKFAETLKDSPFYEPFQFVTNFGSSFFLYPFVGTVTVLLFIWFRHYLPALVFGGGVCLTHKLNTWIKELVMRERPSLSVHLNAEGYSFPSGHAMVSMVCYGLLAYFITRKIQSERMILFVQISFTVLIFLIGISRYVLYVHYLTDILAGFFIGYFILVGLIYLYEFIRTKRTQT